MKRLADLDAVLSNLLAPDDERPRAMASLSLFEIFNFQNFFIKVFLEPEMLIAFFKYLSLIFLCRTICLQFLFCVFVRYCGGSIAAIRSPSSSQDQF